jgi:hypothetical protein
MAIGLGPQQPTDADSPTREIWLLISKATTPRLVPSEKQYQAIVSTDDGRQIDRKQEQEEEANSPTVEIRHLASDVRIDS